MDDETQYSGDEGGGDGDGSDSTTSSTVDTGAGSESGSTQSPPAQQGQTQPPTQQERTFNQQQVNTYLANERRKWEAAAQRAAQDRERQRAPVRETPGVTPRPFDPETRAALEDFLRPVIQPLNEARQAAEIERATTAIQSKHPELADQANMDAVINTVLAWGEDIVNRAPMSWLLEQGYNSWKYGSFDEKAYKEKTISEYVASKSKQARETPPPQGGGGRATTSKKGAPKDWKGADAAMKSLIEEGQASQ